MIQNFPSGFLMAIESAITKHAGYMHDSIDNNAAARIKASVIGTSENIPVCEGKLMIGTWHNIFLCEFDGPRHERKAIVTIVEGK